MSDDTIMDRTTLENIVRGCLEGTWEALLPLMTTMVLDRLVHEAALRAGGPMDLHIDVPGPEDAGAVVDAEEAMIRSMVADLPLLDVSVERVH